MEEGHAGVGLFFQQSPHQGIFVASVTPGCSAARTGCIQKDDLVVKVNEESVAGHSLAQLRQLVLGPPGSTVVFTFRRKTSDSTSFCYDVDLMRGTGEFLDLVERNVQQTLVSEDLRAQLTRTEKSCSAMEADIQALVHHPTMKVEDRRTSELAHELKCRMEDLRRLQATQLRVEERCRELEKRKVETQERLERERSERMKGEAQERDRKEQINDIQRGHADEGALAASVLEKLQHDVKLESDQRQVVEEHLSKAMAEFHDMKAQMLDLRMRQQRLRRIINFGSESMDKALRLNQGVYSDLAAIVPSMDNNQNTFLKDLLGAVRSHDQLLPPLPSVKLSLSGFSSGPSHGPAVFVPGQMPEGLHTNRAGTTQGPFQPQGAHTAAMAGALPKEKEEPIQQQPPQQQPPPPPPPPLQGVETGVTGGIASGRGFVAKTSSQGNAEDESVLDVDSIARKYGLRLPTPSGPSPHRGLAVAAPATPSLAPSASAIFSANEALA